MAHPKEPVRKGTINEHGAEVLDPTPVAIPAGFEVPETMSEMIRRVTMGALSQQAAAEGMETFEESEDFDIDDETFEPTSPYEAVFDPVLGRDITLQEFKDNQAIYKERFERAEQMADDAAYEAFARSEALRARFKAEHEPPPAEQSGREATPEESGSKK